MNLKMTKHAFTRCQQRGVKADMVDMVMSEGMVERLPGGAKGYFLRRKDRERLKTLYKRKLQALDHLSEVHVVESVDGMVLTIYRKR